MQPDALERARHPRAPSAASSTKGRETMKRRKKLSSCLVFELHGHHVSSIDDIRDLLKLWNVCDAQALKIIRYHVGKAIGKFCVGVYMNGGNVYALYPS